MGAARTRVILGLFVVVPLLIETGFRLLEGPLGIEHGPIADLRAYLRSGRTANFAPHPYSVFVRPSAKDHVNAQGFSDVKWARKKRPGVTRILCLGGSTTESGNPLGLLGSYPYLLEQELERRTHLEYEVMNAGISGWTTAEMLTSWFLLLRDYEPDVLILHEGVNDLHPRFQAGFRPDYSHWRRPMPSAGGPGPERWLAWSDLYLWLRLKRSGMPDIMVVTSRPHRSGPLEADGSLPLETLAPFVRNLGCIARDARSQGARVVCMTMPCNVAHVGVARELWRGGMEQLAKALRGLARDEGLELVDAARVFDERRTELEPEFRDLVHLLPAGNQVKAELLADRLLTGMALSGR